MHLEAEFIMNLKVTIGEFQIIGESVYGHSKVIPILGGTFTGPKIKGTIVPGGADWNTLINGEIRRVFAKYTLLTDDGEYISIENEGYSEENKPKPRIRTVPKFTVGKNSQYTFLQSGVFVGTLVKGDGDFVEISLYKLN